MIESKARIKPYKLVSIGSLSGVKKGGASSTAGILKKNVEAVNSVGVTLNGLIGSLNKFLAVQAEAFKLEQGLAAQARARQEGNVESVGGPQQERSSSGMMAWVKGAAKSFWSALTDMFKDVLRAFIVLPALKWLSKPENQKALTETLQTIGNVLKTIWDWLSKRVTNILDGFSSMIDDNKGWQERLGGFLKFALNLGAILLGIRWLTNPVKMVKDFVGVFKLLRGFIKNAGRMMRSRAGRWGLAIAALGAVGAEIFTDEDSILKPSNLAKTVADAAGFNDGERTQLESGLASDEPTVESKTGTDGKSGNDGKDGSEGKPGREIGGNIVVNNTPLMATGGLISGPDSGYPVSLDGGRSVSFIGHGTELVLGRESGGGFVVPLNNRATRRNPGLTNKRFGEAFKGGFGREKGGRLPEREGGGLVNWVGAQWNRFTGGGGTKPKQGTSAEKTPSASTQGKEKNNPYSNLPAVQAVGRMILAKGFTVGEHPNFKKNSYSGSGANSGGWDPTGSQRVGGHSGGSLHYSNLALDVTDWRDGDWKGRTRKLAAEMFKNRKKLKLSQIIHDGWGYWFDGNSNYTAAPYGGHDTHLHLGFLRGKADKDASVSGSGAGDIGGDMPSASGADIAGADTTGASMGTGLKTYVPTAVSDSMAGLNMDYSGAIDPSKYNPANVLQMSKDNLSLEAGAKQAQQASIAQIMQTSMAASAQATKQAQAIVKAASGSQQDIAIPLGGNGGNSNHLYIGHYAPKFGLYSRK